MIQPATRHAILSYLEGFLDNFLDNFIQRFQTTQLKPRRRSAGDAKPFHIAILGPKVRPILSFERSFSTSLGTTFEESARLIALSRFAEAEREYTVKGSAPAAALTTIDSIDRRIREFGKTDSYPSLVAAVANTYRADLSPREMKVDLYVKDQTGNECFFEIKTPEPNRSQCLTVTREHLTIHAIKGAGPPKIRTYYGMAYNPYGPRKDQYRWSFARQLLDLENQVLIGDEFWDFLGGKGTYEELLAIYEEAGIVMGQNVIERLTNL
ncbi:MAG: TdeIII family type II restriction endonuclease [Chloroflexi bacterium]|nr:TdeIII family type II restriction endonuclease [Chloroflexota bacterium]